MLQPCPKGQSDTFNEDRQIFLDRNTWDLCEGLQLNIVLFAYQFNHSYLRLSGHKTNIVVTLICKKYLSTPIQIFLNYSFSE